jgi:hypothetical protein
MRIIEPHFRILTDFKDQNKKTQQVIPTPESLNCVCDKANRKEIEAQSLFVKNFFANGNLTKSNASPAKKSGFQIKARNPKDPTTEKFSHLTRML